MKERLAEEFGALEEEVFSLYLLDEKSFILSKASFACGLKDEVFIDPKELAQSIIGRPPETRGGDPQSSERQSLALEKGRRNDGEII